MQHSEIKIGKYKHYKGGEYRLIGLAKHSETLEDVVVYEDLNYNNVSQLWVRPLSMFKEEVEQNGMKVKRFEYIEE